MDVCVSVREKERGALWHWFYLIQTYKSTLLEQEMWDILFLFPPISDRGIDRSYLFLLPVYDRLSLLEQIQREGRLRKEMGSDWVRMMLRSWCIGWQMRGWGEGTGWREKNDLTLACTLLSSYPCPASFMSQPRVDLPAAPDGAVYLGCPLQDVPLSPPQLQTYTCLIDFRGEGPVSLLFHTHIHTHRQLANSYSAPSAHTHTRGWRCALSTLIQFETRECD